MTRAKELSKILSDGNLTGTLDVAGTSTLDVTTVTGNLVVYGGTIKLDGNYPTSSNNVALGNSAGVSLTSGTKNTLMGSSAGDSITEGDFNTAIGNNSLSADTLGNRSTAVGHGTLTTQNFTSATDTHNTAVGFGAGNGITTGSENTLIGSGAGGVLTVGGSVTAVGKEALGTGTDGNGNTAIGYRSLYDMTSGARNVGLGEQAGRGITTGNDNIAAGQQSFFGTCTGSGNIGLGYRSFFGATSAASNVGVGYQTLNDISSPSENVAVGYRALPHVSTGDSNIGIGYATGDGVRGVGLTTGASNILIGRQADTPASNTGYSIVMGVHAVGKGSSTGFISPNDGSVYQGNNSSSWATTSDKRLKKNIEDNTTGLDAINQVQVRNFEYRTADEITELASTDVINKSGTQLGVIAQEIQTILPDMVKQEDTGVLSVDPDNMTWYLVNAVKELSAQVTQLTAKINKLEGN